MIVADDLMPPSRRDAQLAARAAERLSGYLDQPNTVKIRLGTEGAQEYLAVPDVLVHLLSRILTETASDTPFPSFLPMRK